MTNNTFAYAVGLADKGMYVFPLAPGEKVPLMGSSGFKDATRDVDQILRWKADNPNYNIGIRTGKESNLVVLDVDDNSEFYYRHLVDVPDTVKVRTPGHEDGAYHAYFKYPTHGRLKGSADLVGVDIKADGGYVVAPPSLHPNGGEYAWEISPDDAEIAECPDWLLVEEPEEDIVVVQAIGDLMHGQIDPPELLVEDLLYKNGITSLYAPGGSGKTIFALWLANQVIEQGLRVLYTDEEMGALRIAERLNHLGADPDTVNEYFLYVNAPGLTLKESLEMWRTSIRVLKPELVVFDPFADLLALSNLSENDAGDVTRWIKAFVDPVTEAGASTLLLDHVAKDDSGKYARGSGAKHAKVDAAWKLKTTKPFDRFNIGEVEFHKDKDRFGRLPAKVKFGVGGDGQDNLIIERLETQNQWRRGELKPSFAAVLDILKKTPGMTRQQWWKAADKEDISKGTFEPAFTKLKDEEYIWQDERNKQWYPAERAYEEDMLEELEMQL